MTETKPFPTDEQIADAAEIVKQLSLIPKMDDGYAVFSRDGLGYQQWLHRSNLGDCGRPGDVEVRVPGHELGRVSDPDDRHQLEFCRLAVRHAVEWLDVFEAESEKAEAA